MDNRRYVKRVWRVPKHRGALEYFGTLVLKALVKHGWPARLVLDPETDGFLIERVGATSGALPPDMLDAIAIACRVTARSYRVEVSQYGNWCGLDRQYRVVHGHFREIKS